MKEFSTARVLNVGARRDLIALFNTVESTSYNVTRDSNGMAVRQDIIDLPDEGYGFLYHMVELAILKANQDNGWNFDLTGWNQPLRVSRYRKGYMHDWHTDYGKDDRSKVAFSCLLNDGFTGGQFDLLESDVPDLRPGYAVMFPAFQGHRVTKITSGERFVLLGWYTGPRFV